MVKSILAAVDGSPIATDVVEKAKALARSFDAHLYLFRVVSLPPDIPAASYHVADSTPDALMATTRVELETLAANDPRITVLPPVVSAAAAWRLILGEGRRHHVDLIVIGSHGYSGWDHILGTTAARISNRADRDVFIVHGKGARAQDA